MKWTAIVITGGIGTGKTAFSSALRSRLGGVETRFFDADTCVHELLTKPGVAQKVSQEFGSSVIGADGSVSRPALREVLFSCGSDKMPRARERLEAILHPLVEEEYGSALRLADSSAPGGLFIADIPLYFESDSQAYRPDHVTVVGCSPDVQRARVFARGLERGIPERDSRELIAAQLPVSEKMERADSVVWNDGPVGLLDSQADRLVDLFSNSLVFK